MTDMRLLREEQLRRAAEVVRHDDMAFAEPAFVAGADVGFEREGAVTRAAIAVLSYPGLELVEYRIARIDTVLPYIPGFLSFREYPALLEAWRQLRQRLDLLFVDGHGVSHPRRLGVASHFGLQVDVPTIGVAKRRLCGRFDALDEAPGSRQALVDREEQIGWVWRSKPRCNPLFISTGHRIGLDSALLWVSRCMRGYRLPEPTRWADAVASDRPAFQRWLTR